MVVSAAEAVLALVEAVPKELGLDVEAATAVEFAPEGDEDDAEPAGLELEANVGVLEIVDPTVEDPLREEVSWPREPETLKSGDWARMPRPMVSTKLIW